MSLALIAQAQDAPKDTPPPLPPLPPVVPANNSGVIRPVRSNNTARVIPPRTIPTTAANQTPPTTTFQPAPTQRPINATRPTTANGVPQPPQQPGPQLTWDSESKEATVKDGEYTVNFTFYGTNTTDAPIVINNVRTSCGCTAANLPTLPHTIAPGTNVAIGVTMDLRGKRGAITKIVAVETATGVKNLLVKGTVPETDGGVGNMGNRSRNLQIAAADRQAVFRGDCASCHVIPTAGKTGKQLYAAACGICHEAEHRASMVPDLKIAKEGRNEAFWEQWVKHGKPNTLMPAFSQAEGGPLSDDQIKSLVEYLAKNFSTFPVGNSPATVPAAAPATSSAPAHP